MYNGVPGGGGPQYYIILGTGSPKVRGPQYYMTPVWY